MRTRTFLPRPEYPRPDRQRSFVQGVDWLNLNGAWEFRFDPERVGLAEEWFVPSAPQWPDQIIVPFCWESLAAWGEADAAGNDNFFSTRVYRNPLDVNRTNYRSAARHEVGWYRRYIRIPGSEPWQGRRVILTVGAADFFTQAWCNGQDLGTNEEGFTPFEFDITDTLERDRSGQRCGTIVFRVEDRMSNHDQPVGKQWGWYSSASGIWQTVFVEPRAENHIKRFEITTDIEKAQVRFKIFVSGGNDLLVQITSPTGEKFTERLTIHDCVADKKCRLGSTTLWDPNAPHLYRVEFTLRDGSNSPDVVHGYFGMRSLAAVTIAESGAPGTLSLNGQPI